MKKTFSFF